MDIREQVIEALKLNIDKNNVVIPPNTSLGDYAIATFMLAKDSGLNPIEYARKVADTTNPSGIIDSIEAVGPYINIRLKRERIISDILSEIFSKQKSYGASDIGKNRVVCLDYSSINLAKHPHIGHLCTTVIGACLFRLLQKQNFRVISINYVGDYGTPFGKIIAAFCKWGNKEEVERIGVDVLQDLYVRISALDEDDPLLDEAREWFARIERKDAKALELYNWIVDIAKRDINQIYEKLGIKFDSWRGESAYNEATDSTVKALTDLNLLTLSEGAKLVDLDNYGLGKYLILKSDGSSLYSTRDIAAAIDRKNTYNFDLSLYVTDISQKQHFQSLFKVLELMGYEWAKDCKHIAYGRRRTPEGKISSRRGKVAVLKDIFEVAEAKAREITRNRNLPDSVATHIGDSAVVFGILKTERLKDVVFDIDNSLNFDGETSVYLQYMNARINSIFEKVGDTDLGRFDTSLLTSDDEYELCKELATYEQVLSDTTRDYEPCYIARYVIGLATLFGRFYNNCKIIGDDKEITHSRLALTRAVQIVLVDAMELLGVRVVEKM